MSSDGSYIQLPIIYSSELLLGGKLFTVPINYSSEMLLGGKLFTVTNFVQFTDATRREAIYGHKFTTVQMPKHFWIFPEQHREEEGYQLITIARVHCWLYGKCYNKPVSSDRLVGNEHALAWLKPKMH